MVYTACGNGSTKVTFLDVLPSLKHAQSSFPVLIIGGSNNRHPKSIYCSEKTIHFI